MLASLAIRDIVLIERLDLPLDAGLCVLTGETGAGKSILLDALGLALGGRAERGLVRRGAAQGSVVAAFALADDDPVHEVLAEHGIAREDLLVLRRVIGTDGRSRAYLNDQPVGSALLRRVGELLVEVHGQHEQQGLLGAPTQRRLLDGFGQLEDLADALRARHGDWRAAERAAAAGAAELEQAAAEEHYLRHALAELEELAPEVGEETVLVERRARVMGREKLLRAIQEAVDLLRGVGDLPARLGGAQRAIERVAPGAGHLQDAASALERARVEVEEAAAGLMRAGAELEREGGDPEGIEERLFALRAAARKHRVAVDELPALRADLEARLARVDAGADALRRARALAAAARAAFEAQAAALSTARAAAAQALAEAVMTELPPLRLEQARFVVRLVPLAPEEWSGEGRERIVFEVATNPGEEPQPLSKVASGGELARLMLALKVVLAKVNSTPCLVFDEVDTGIGGATADAVGERLARLARGLQVLVVTHAPQVAARADHHFRVEKGAAGERATVSVGALDGPARREEIARMLAGARITDAARAAADSLIAHSA